MHVKFDKRMKNRNLLLLCMAVFLSSCASEFNKVYKTADNDYKYEYAKQCFAMGKFQQASSLLQDLVLVTKGRDHAQECLYLLGMAEYENRLVSTSVSRSIAEPPSPVWIRRQR